MGAEQSTPQQPIYPQPQPICATEPRFCLPHNVQLHLKEKFFSMSGDDFKITDANNKAIIYFQCEGRTFSLSEKKVLRDNAGVPVLNMKEKMFRYNLNDVTTVRRTYIWTNSKNFISFESCSFNDKFNIFAGEGSERQICKFNSQFSFLKAKLSAVFPDVLNRGMQRHLVLKGDWRSKNCAIYLGEPKQGGIPLARIYRPLTQRSFFMGVDDYIIEIAANVDIAICVIMCIALDEHSRER